MEKGRLISPLLSDEKVGLNPNISEEDTKRPIGALRGLTGGCKTWFTINSPARLQEA
ncbi:hypothetical protein TUM17377_16920 [Shewanella chilikensis]|nr:hypothetical protein TUM17377_16920 [Shewanella chilikensis]